MVDISFRLKQIERYVERGEYLAINRARQYGKTTTLRALKAYLKDKYYIISMDFQTQMSNAKFSNENTFSVAFAKAFIRILEKMNTMFPEKMREAVEGLERAVRESRQELELVELFQYLSDICGAADKPLVLLIDEVDSASNNQVFLDFLAQLRGYYIDRDNTPSFQSVILAGVYDIRNLKRKFRPEEDHKMNSPWNIAVEFKEDMSFSAREIAGMLEDYKLDTVKDMATGTVTPTGLPSSNVLYYDMNDNAWLCIRPSGTEPKIKFYYGIKGTSLEDADARSAALGEALMAEVDKLL